MYSYNVFNGSCAPNKCLFFLLIDFDTPFMHKKVHYINKARNKLLGVYILLEPSTESDSIAIDYKEYQCSKLLFYTWTKNIF